MKFKLVEDIDLEEVFFSKKNRDIHHYKHVVSDEDGPLKMDYLTPEEYDTLADKLSSADAEKLNNRDAKIIGYITKDGRIVKHDKENNLTVVYVDDDIKGHEVISLYKQPTKKFFIKLNTEGTRMSFGKNIK